MKKTSQLLLIGTALALVFSPEVADAQRTFVERPGASIGVRHAGDWRASNSLNHLNRELREVQLLARRAGSGRARSRLARIARETDRLNYQYHRRLTRPYSIHRRAETLRAEVRAMRSTVPRRGWGWL